MIGCGKSAAANFFLKEAFCADMKFLPVTTREDCGKGIVGGKLIKFIDIPVLLDWHDGFKIHKLAEAIIAVPNGIHALGVVINIGARVTSSDAKLYEDILAFTGLLPYVFFIFSHAYCLGVTHEEQQHNFETSVNDHKILQKLLKDTENRYIVLESVLNKENEYYDLKADKLAKIVNSIIDKQKRPFTSQCPIAGLARSLMQSKISQEEVIKALKRDLMKAREELERKERLKFLFWK